MSREIFLLMLDIKLIRENPELVKKAIDAKNEKGNIDQLLENDEKRRNIIFKVEDLKKQRNDNSNLVAQFKREKKDTTDLINKTKSISNEIKILDQQLLEVEKVIHEDVLKIPNIPHQTTPIGKNELSNVVVNR